ncbi:MAG TPA: hypothetical protein VIX91_17285 [Candidatus Acidoferrum sp.]
MDQNNRKPAYPPGLTEAAAAERQAEAKEIAEYLAGKAAPESAQSRCSPVTIAPENYGASPARDFVTFVNQTKRVWLMVVGAIVGLILVITLLQRGFEWFSKSRERRHERAVASVTPEHLLARCGQPVEDVTREVYPVLIRTMTYQIGSRETYVLQFSRTAEENSDWVFLSMTDVNGKSYESPEEKVAAMSCLNSWK